MRPFVRTRCMRCLSVILMSAVSLTACGGDDPLSVGDPLNDEEALALASAVFLTGASQAYENLPSAGATAQSGPEDVSAASRATAGSAASAFAVEPVDYTETTSVTAPCELGGTVAVDLAIDGTIDEEAGYADVTMDLVQTHQQCVVFDEGSELQFTLTGEPDLGFDFRIVMDQTAIDLSGSLAGRIGWETDDDRSGSCVVNMSFDVSGGGEGDSSMSVQGHFCGVQLTQNVAVGIT